MICKVVGNSLRLAALGKEMHWMLQSTMCCGRFNKQTAFTNCFKHGLCYYECILKASGLELHNHFSSFLMNLWCFSKFSAIFWSMQSIVELLVSYYEIIEELERECLSIKRFLVTLMGKTVFWSSLLHGPTQLHLHFIVWWEINVLMSMDFG